jgi:hypothetical protein
MNNVKLLLKKALTNRRTAEALSYIHAPLKQNCSQTAQKSAKAAAGEGAECAVSSPKRAHLRMPRVSLGDMRITVGNGPE